MDCLGRAPLFIATVHYTAHGKLCWRRVVALCMHIHAHLHTRSELTGLNAQSLHEISTHSNVPCSPLHEKVFYAVGKTQSVCVQSVCKRRPT